METTNLVKSITDDQIAEIELDFQSARKLGREAYIDTQDGEALIARLREAERDAARYQWIRSRFVGVSFDWDDEGMTVLAFEMPPSLSIGADCDRNIDDAMLSAREAAE